jgi:hypothetical protein
MGRIAFFRYALEQEFQARSVRRISSGSTAMRVNYVALVPLNHFWPLPVA